MRAAEVPSADVLVRSQECVSGCVLDLRVRCMRALEASVLGLSSYFEATAGCAGCAGVLCP